MKTTYALKDGVLIEAPPESSNVFIYTVPDEAEKHELLTNLKIDRYSLDSALDPDEIPRIEFTPDHTYIIWKRPDNVSVEDKLKFEISSIGLCMQSGRLTIILGRKNVVPFDSRSFQKISSLNDLMIKFILNTIHHYLGHLRGIKQVAAEVQHRLNESMENRYFLQMFNLSESLIYYLNALETSSAVLTKIRANTEKMGFTKEEIETLDDTIIEHQQCSKQIEIYSSILSGLMDARGNIINNNMNIMLRNLTLINVVFLPLNLLASIGGMSEYSAMTRDMSMIASYTIFISSMVIIGYLTWNILIRKIDRLGGRGRGYAK